MMMRVKTIIFCRNLFCVQIVLKKIDIFNSKIQYLIKSWIRMIKSIQFLRTTHLVKVRKVTKRRKSSPLKYSMIIINWYLNMDYLMIITFVSPCKMLFFSKMIYVFTWMISMEIYKAELLIYKEMFYVK